MSSKQRQRLFSEQMILNVSHALVVLGSRNLQLTRLLVDGLYASVFSRDINKALRVARALEAGSVGVNTTSPYGAYELPFGGFKSSGIGRQKGSESLLSWTQQKAVFINHDD